MKKYLNAINGIVLAIKGGGSIKIQLVVAVVVILLGFYFEISSTEWVFVVFSCGLVLAGEAFNTAIEKLCDFIEPNQNELIGKIKDIAAGAVLIIALTTIVVGVIIFVPKIFNTWLNF